MTDQPWTDEQARWLFRGAAILARAGAEPVGPIVLPDARFFPDRFDGSTGSVGQLFERLKEHVGLSDVPTHIAITDPDDGSVVSSCSSGGCSTGAVKTLSGGRVTSQKGGSYAVQVAAPEIKNPVVLTTVLTRAIGEIFAREADALSGFAAKERAPAADLAASLLGLGVLIANGSGIEVKGCGGVKIHSATSLSSAEATLALALAVERDKLRRPENATAVAAIVRGLDAVPRAMFQSAAAFIDANRAVVRRIDDAPDALASGNFSLKTPGASLTGRLFGVFGFGKAKDADPLDELEREAMLLSHSAPALAPTASPTQQTSTAKQARLAEIRALVDESFE